MIWKGPCRYCNTVVDRNARYCPACGRIGPCEEDESGDRWTVLEVNRSDLNRIWQCVSQCYAVKFGLDEHVDHLRVTHMKTSAGTLRACRAAR